MSDELRDGQRDGAGWTPPTAPSRETPPVRVLGAREIGLRPFERYLASLGGYRRSLLHLGGWCVVGAGAVAWLGPEWGGGSMLPCVALAAAGAYCLGRWHGLGETQRLLRFVVRHVRREGRAR